MPVQNSTVDRYLLAKASRISSAGRDGEYKTPISVLNNSERKTVAEEYRPVTIPFKSSPLFLDHTKCRRHTFVKSTVIKYSWMLTVNPNAKVIQRRIPSLSAILSFGGRTEKRTPTYTHTHSLSLFPSSRYVFLTTNEPGLRYYREGSFGLVFVVGM